MSIKIRRCSANQITKAEDDKYVVSGKDLSEGNCREGIYRRVGITGRTGYYISLRGSGRKACIYVGITSALIGVPASRAMYELTKDRTLVMEVIKA